MLKHFVVGFSTLLLIGCAQAHAVKAGDLADTGRQKQRSEQHAARQRERILQFVEHGCSPFNKH